MAAYLDGLGVVRLAGAVREIVGRRGQSVIEDIDDPQSTENTVGRFEANGYIPNVWLGTSTENQATADERIPHLLRCPAAVRFLSVEPMIGPVELFDVDGSVARAMQRLNPREMMFPADVVDWVIVGGESGSKARRCDVEWIRSIVQQCKAAGVACFVKQVGSKPHGFGQWNHPDNEGRGVNIEGRRLSDRKGGDPSEWPEDLRVREMPRQEGGKC